MLYRKCPPIAPTLLLRIVATAGTSAFLGLSACGGESLNLPNTADSGRTGQAEPCGGGGPCGSAALPPDAGQGTPSPVTMGVVPNPTPDPPDAGQPSPCGGHPCGSMIMPPDSGVVGIAPLPRDAGQDGHPAPIPPDAGEDSSRVGGGVVIRPDAGADAQGPCQGHPCGIIIMPPDAGHP